MMATNPTKLRIKCHLGTEIRVQTHLSDETLDVFAAKIRMEYDLEDADIALLYRDEEGDIITIRTDNDLREAFESVTEGISSGGQAPSPSPSQTSIHRPRSSSGGSSNAYGNAINTAQMNNANISSAMSNIYNHGASPVPSPHGVRPRTNSESRAAVLRRTRSGSMSRDLDGRERERPRSGSSYPALVSGYGGMMPPGPQSASPHAFVFNPADLRHDHDQKLTGFAFGKSLDDDLDGSKDQQSSTPTTQHSTTSLSTFFQQQQREQLEQLRQIEISQRSFNARTSGELAVHSDDGDDEEDLDDDNEDDVHPHFNAAAAARLYKQQGKFEQDTENSASESDGVKTDDQQQTLPVGGQPGPIKPRKTLYDLLDGGGQEIEEAWSSGISSTSPNGTPSATKPLRWTRGSFGQVYQGLNVETGEIFAVKQIALPTSDDDSLRKELERIQKEIDLLRVLKHENVVRYYGTELKDNFLNIFLEYLPGGSISSMINKFGPFAEDTIRVYTRQILNGLQYLHSMGVVHRDIKGGNILIDSNGIAKLADFGASKVLNGILHGPTQNTTEANSFKGTCYFMAPEVIRQTGHGRKADVWSLACTIVEMATGKPPYAGTPAVTAIFKIASATEPPPIPGPEILSETARDFLTKCFVLDPKHRASVTTLLSHPFLKSVSTVDSQQGITPSGSTRARGGSGTLLEKSPSAGQLVQQPIGMGSVTGAFVPENEPDDR